jgi:DNA-binding GntR family transcriptional regulator
MWLPKLEQFPGPRYQALAAAIEAAIRTGELPVGAKLPPQRDLAWKLGVTVRRGRPRHLRETDPSARPP